jgi:hypothetical protein
MGEQPAAQEVPAGPEITPVPRRPKVKRRRVLIGDARRNGRYLRATWHPEGRMFVLSTWTDEVCTGAVRVPVDQAADLVNLLADGLGDAAGTPLALRHRQSPLESAQAHVQSWKADLFRWMRGGAAKATEALGAREASAGAKVHQHRRR